MQMLVLMWLQLHAAQQCLRETIHNHCSPDDGSHLNSSPTVAQPDGEIAGREVDPVSSDRRAGNEGECAAKE
jgi:hypothetical protein